MRHLILLSISVLSGCALHNSGALKPPTRGTVPALRAAQAPAAGDSVFTPQLVSKVLEVWSVRGCPGAAVPIASIYRIAAAHGISYIEPETAKAILETRTAAGIAVEVAGISGGAVAIVLGLKWVQAKTAWHDAAAAVSGVFGWLIPTLEKQVPPVPCSGQDFMVDSRGCGVALFCAQPSAVGAFTEMLK